MTGFLADRMSINLELPTAESLHLLAPHKSRKNILSPMRYVQKKREENTHELALYRHAPQFVPAGQSTQMIIGATPESDYQIIRVAESLYQKFELKRVFYSAFVHVNEDSALPARTDLGPPLLREHRIVPGGLASAVLSFFGRGAFIGRTPEFQSGSGSEVRLGPAASGVFSRWRSTGLITRRCFGCRGSAIHPPDRIVRARRTGTLDFTDLKKMGVVLKRALLFCDMQREDDVSDTDG